MTKTVNSIIGFQEPVTQIMEGIIDLHNEISFWLLFILIFIVWILFTIIINFYIEPLKDLRTRNLIIKSQFVVHGTFLELFWTISPSLILLAIAIPSFSLLYSLDVILEEYDITCKIIGHQWFWEYEIPCKFIVYK